MQQLWQRASTLRYTNFIAFHRIVYMNDYGQMPRETCTKEVFVERKCAIHSVDLERRKEIIICKTHKCYFLQIVSIPCFMATFKNDYKSWIAKILRKWKNFVSEKLNWIIWTSGCSSMNQFFLYFQDRRKILYKMTIVRTARKWRNLNNMTMTK